LIVFHQRDSHAPFAVFAERFSRGQGELGVALHASAEADRNMTIQAFARRRARAKGAVPAPQIAAVDGSGTASTSLSRRITWLAVSSAGV
jgi:hypothetical protein